MYTLHQIYFKTLWKFVYVNRFKLMLEFNLIDSHRTTIEMHICVVCHFIVQLLYFCSAKSGWSVMISECCLNVLNGCLIVWVKDEDLFMNIFKLFQETVIELVQ